MRNTSPVGWIPLLALKVIYEGSLPPFVISLFNVALPVIAITTILDSIFYFYSINSSTESISLVFTGYNFFQRNIVEGLSEYFGSAPMTSYVFKFAPEIFTLMYPVVIVATCYTHIKLR